MKPSIFPLGLVGAVILIGFLGCGGFGSSTHNKYAVNAQVLVVAGGMPKACPGVPLTNPPTDCGGVELGNVDASSVHGAVVYSNGTVETSVLHLVGTWDGTRLNLLSPPAVMKHPVAVTPLQACKGFDQAPPRQSVLELQKAVLRDRDILAAHHLSPLKTEPCGKDLLIVVPVADQKAIEFLKDRYVSVTVSGWLEKDNS
jgi:hypothetical protein